MASPHLAFVMWCAAEQGQVAQGRADAGAAGLRCSGLTAQQRAVHGRRQWQHMDEQRATLRLD